MEKTHSVLAPHERLISECSRCCRSPEVLNYLRAALRYKLASLIVAGGAGDCVVGSGLRGAAGCEAGRLARPLLLLVADVLLAARLHLTHALLVTESGQQLVRGASDSARQLLPRLDQYEAREVVDWLCPRVPFDPVWREYCRSELPLCLILLRQLANGSGLERSSTAARTADTDEQSVRTSTGEEGVQNFTRDDRAVQTLIAGCTEAEMCAQLDSDNRSRRCFVRGSRGAAGPSIDLSSKADEVFLPKSANYCSDRLDVLRLVDNAISSASPDQPRILTNEVVSCPAADRTAVHQRSRFNQVLTNGVTSEKGFDENMIRHGRLNGRISEAIVRVPEDQHERESLRQSSHQLSGNNGSTTSVSSRREINRCFESLLSVIAEKEQRIRKLEKKLADLEVLLNSQSASKSSNENASCKISSKAVSVQTSKCGTYKRVIDRQESLLKKLTERASQLDEMWNKFRPLIANSILKSGEGKTDSVVQPAVLKVSSVDAMTQTGSSNVGCVSFDNSHADKAPPFSTYLPNGSSSSNKYCRIAENRSNVTHTDAFRCGKSNVALVQGATSKERRTSRKSGDLRVRGDLPNEVDVTRSRISQLWNEVHSLDSQLAAFRIDSDRMQFAVETAKRPLFSGCDDYCVPASGVNAILTQHRVFKAANGISCDSAVDREGERRSSDSHLENIVRPPELSVSSFSEFNFDLDHLTDPYRFPSVTANQSHSNADRLAPFRHRSDLSYTVTSSFHGIPIISSSIETTFSVSPPIYAQSNVGAVVSLGKSHLPASIITPFSATANLKSAANSIFATSEPIIAHTSSKLVPISTCELNPARYAASSQAGVPPISVGSGLQSDEAFIPSNTPNPVIEDGSIPQNDRVGGNRAELVCLENTSCLVRYVESPADHELSCNEKLDMTLGSVEYAGCEEANIGERVANSIPGTVSSQPSQHRPSKSLEAVASPVVDSSNHCDVQVCSDEGSTDGCVSFSHSSNAGSAISVGVKDAVPDDSDFF